MFSAQNGIAASSVKITDACETFDSSGDGPLNLVCRQTSNSSFVSLPSSLPSKTVYSDTCSRDNQLCIPLTVTAMADTPAKPASGASCQNVGVAYSVARSCNESCAVNSYPRATAVRTELPSSAKPIYVHGSAARHLLPVPQPGRNVGVNSPALRLVIPPGWQIPVTCAIQMQTTRPSGIAVASSDSARAVDLVKTVIVNPPVFVRQMQSPVEQLQSSSSATAPNSPIDCTTTSRSSAAANFVPVKRTTEYAAAMHKNPVVHISDDEGSEPELCFYGYEGRPFLQSQVPALPDLLTPDPSCSSQESKSSLDY